MDLKKGFGVFVGIVVFVFVAIFATYFISEHLKEQRLVASAKAQVQQVCEFLDSQTTLTGSYVRQEVPSELKFDSWGKEIKVIYAMGGMAETVTIRSAGSDGIFNTPDDLVACGMSVNGKGVGNGIKTGIKVTAKGAAEGIIEAVQESGVFNFKKKTEEEASSEKED